MLGAFIWRVWFFDLKNFLGGSLSLIKSLCRRRKQQSLSVRIFALPRKTDPVEAPLEWRPQQKSHPALIHHTSADTRCLPAPRGRPCRLSVGGMQGAWSFLL